jgi:hypothetical protein
LEYSNAECLKPVKYLWAARITIKFSHENGNVPEIIPRPERGKFPLIKRHLVNHVNKV